MRKIILFHLLLFFGQYLHSQTCGWIDITDNLTGGSPAVFTDVHFINDQEGWITSLEGSGAIIQGSAIYHTKDGGETFQVKHMPGYASTIHMINELTGYAGGSSGFLFKITDGSTWTHFGSTLSSIADISFPPGSNPDSAIGYLCSGSGGIWKISSTLTFINAGFSDFFSGISTPSVDNTWICGRNNIYFYDGTGFTAQTTPDGKYNDIYFVDNDKGWVVGDSGLIIHTQYGGASPWQTQTNPDPWNRTLNDLFFLDQNIGWAVGESGVILYTSNGGFPWTVFKNEVTTQYLVNACFTFSNNGYVVGSDFNRPLVLKYTNISGMNDVQVSSSIQIYPNPVSEEMNILVPVGTVKIESVIILDLTGRIVWSGSYYTSVNNGVTVKIGDLKSGIYFCQVNFDDRQVIEKLIID